MQPPHPPRGAPRRRTHRGLRRAAMPAAGTRSGLWAGNRERAVKQQGRFKLVEQLLLFTSLCSELLLKLKDGLVEEVVSPHFGVPYT